MSEGQTIKCIGCRAFRANTMDPQFCRGVNPPTKDITCKAGTKKDENIQNSGPSK